MGLLLAATQPGSAPELLEQAAGLDPRLAREAREIARNLQASGRAQDLAYTFLAGGRALAAHDDWDLAAEAFRRATVERPDWAEAWAFLGEARQHLPGPGHGRPEALRCLEKALSLDPNSLTVNLFLALYWRRGDSYRLALAYMHKAAAVDPQNPALQAEIGSFLAEMGDLPAAQDSYQRAIELAPTEAAYWRFLAEFSLQHGIQVRQVALPAARRAVILAPRDPASLDVMGQTLYLLGDYTNAERFLSNALLVDPAYAPAHLHLGMNALMQGQTPSARRQLSLAISLAPQTPLAEQAQRFLQRYLLQGNVP
jgi:tetratricopeptide (TPR) repeat protein